MSITAMTRVRALAPVDKTHLIMLESMADFCNEHDICYAGTKALSYYTRVSERWGRILIDELHTMGMIYTKPGGKGRGVRAAHMVAVALSETQIYDRLVILGLPPNEAHQTAQSMVQKQREYFQSFFANRPTHAIPRHVKEVARQYGIVEVLERTDNGYEAHIDPQPPAPAPRRPNRRRRTSDPRPDSPPTQEDAPIPPTACNHQIEKGEPPIPLHQKGELPIPQTREDAPIPQKTPLRGIARVSLGGSPVSVRGIASDALGDRQCQNTPSFAASESAESQSDPIMILHDPMIHDPPPPTEQTMTRDKTRTEQFLEEEGFLTAHEFRDMPYAEVVTYIQKWKQQKLYTGSMVRELRRLQHTMGSSPHPPKQPPNPPTHQPMTEVALTAQARALRPDLTGYQLELLKLCLERTPTSAAALEHFTGELAQIHQRQERFRAAQGKESYRYEQRL